jgi:hypothetical protein
LVGAPAGALAARLARGAFFAGGGAVCPSGAVPAVCSVICCSD